MPWFSHAPVKPTEFTNQQPGRAEFVPVPSGNDNLPYRIWVTGTKDFSLAQVSQQAYGLSSLWPKIHEANPRVDPFALPAGVHLIIPDHNPGEKPVQRPRGMKRRINPW